MSSIASGIEDWSSLGLRSVDELNATQDTGDELGMDTFLELMTTQLQNQDPTNPTDSTEFVSQLAQFASVQGLDTLNENFDTLASSITSSQALQAGSLINRNVLTEGNYARLNQETGLQGELELESSGSDVQVRFYSASGTLMKTLDLGTQSSGSLSYKWDGTMDTGGSAPEGVYRVEADYYDGDNRVSLNNLVSARVESVVVGGSGEALTLNLEGLGSVSFNKVSRIQ
jgi:flagellar basal-body rod modification protein FlgD